MLIIIIYFINYGIREKVVISIVIILCDLVSFRGILYFYIDIYVGIILMYMK